VPNKGNVPKEMSPLSIPMVYAVASLLLSPAF